MADGPAYMLRCLLFPVRHGMPSMQAGLFGHCLPFFSLLPSAPSSLLPFLLPALLHYCALPVHFPAPTSVPPTCHLRTSSSPLVCSYSFLPLQHFPSFPFVDSPLEGRKGRTLRLQVGQEGTGRGGQDRTWAGRQKAEAVKEGQEWKRKWEACFGICFHHAATAFRTAACSCCLQHFYTFDLHARATTYLPNPYSLSRLSPATISLAAGTCACGFTPPTATYLLLGLCLYFTCRVAFLAATRTCFACCTARTLLLLAAACMHMTWVRCMPQTFLPSFCPAWCDRTWFRPLCFLCSVARL